jgi:DNA-binding CsgD family transcriptional regulator
MAAAGERRALRAADALRERDSELEAIERVLAAAADGRGASVVIAGPAGIGKSRLLEAAVEAARRRELVPLLACGTEGEREYPFGVALQLLETKLRGADPSERRELFAGAAELATPLFEPAALAGSVSASEDRLFSLVHGLYWLLVNMAERRALVVIVDDVHASDAASLRFLLYLAQRLDGLPVAVILAARTAEPDMSAQLRELIADTPAPVLRPKALSERAVRGLVEDALGFAVSDGFAGECLEVTGGNPFLVRELAAAMVAEGIDERSATPQLARSLTAEAVTQRLLVRLMRLPDPAAALARAVAVLGEDVSLRLAAELAGIDPCAALTAADVLASAEILSPLDTGERVTFAHPLLRTGLYEDLPRGERADAHTRAAALLMDAGAPLERIAAQLLPAQPGAECRAVEFLFAAASSARERGAPSSAAALLQRALEEPLQPGRRGELLLMLAEVALAAGALDQADTVAAEAHRLLGDATARARAQLLRARALFAGARHREAAQALTLGLQEDPGASVANDLRVAYVSVGLFDGDLRRDALAQLETIAETPSAAESAAGRALLAQLALRAIYASQREKALDAAKRAWSDGRLLAGEGPHGDSWTLVWFACMLAGEYPMGELIADAVLEEARRRGAVMAFATASTLRSWCGLLTGRLPDAIADAQQALDAARYGWSRYTRMVTAAGALALIERGELAAAETMIADAEHKPGERSLELAFMLHTLARLAAERGAHREALDHELEAGRILEQELSATVSILDWRTGAALAAHRLGEQQLAEELSHAALGRARTLGNPVFIGRALHTTGVITREPTSVELLEQATSVLEASHARLEYAHALVDYGTALRRANRRRDAHAPLDHGYQLAGRAGAKPLCERAAVELSTLGARPRKEIRTGADALTPSERRISQMAASGMTNKQIAQALFVTIKAVEWHLRHAYQKLDITSRTELDRALGADR